MKKVLLMLLILLLMPIYAGMEQQDVLDSSPEDLLILWQQIGDKLRESGHYPYILLKSGDKGNEVLSLQQRLASLGYFAKTITGRYDSSTQAAMKLFEKAHKFKQDGIASIEEQILMFSADAIVKPTPSPKPTPTPKPTPRLPAPKGVVVKSLSPTSVKITWQKVANAREYKVYRSTSSSGKFTQIATTMFLEYIDKNLSPGKTYYYRVESKVSSNISVQTTPKIVKMPTPSPTPFIEPKYSLVEGEYADWGTSYGYPWFEYQVKNVSKTRIVDGFTLVIYATDVYGNKIRSHGFGDYYLYETYNQTVQPGKSLYSKKRTIYGFDNLKYLYIAIQKYHLTNGTTIEIPERELHFGRIGY